MATSDMAPHLLSNYDCRLRDSLETCERFRSVDGHKHPIPQNTPFVIINVQVARTQMTHLLNVFSYTEQPLVKRLEHNNTPAHPRSSLSDRRAVQHSTTHRPWRVRRFATLDWARVVRDSRQTQGMLGFRSSGGPWLIQISSRYQCGERQRYYFA